MECCFFFIRKLLKKEKKCWVWLLSCQRECFPSPGGRSPVRHREPWLKQMGDWGIPQSIMSDGTSLIQSKLSSSVKTALFFLAPVRLCLSCPFRGADKEKDLLCSPCSIIWKLSKSWRLHSPCVHGFFFLGITLLTHCTCGNILVYVTVQDNNCPGSETCLFCCILGAQKVTETKKTPKLCIILNKKLQSKV